MQKISSLINTLLIVMTFNTINSIHANQDATPDYWKSIKEQAEKVYTYSAAKSKELYDEVSTHTVTKALLADAKTGCEVAITGAISAYQAATTKKSEIWELIKDNEHVIFVTAAAKGSADVAYKWITSQKEKQKSNDK